MWQVFFKSRINDIHRRCKKKKLVKFWFPKFRFDSKMNQNSNQRQVGNGEPARQRSGTSSTAPCGADPREVPLPRLRHTYGWVFAPPTRPYNNLRVKPQPGFCTSQRISCRTPWAALSWGRTTTRTGRACRSAKAGWPPAASFQGGATANGASVTSDLILGM